MQRLSSIHVTFIHPCDLRLCTNLDCAFFHVRGTKRSVTPVKNVETKSNAKKTSGSTCTNNMAKPSENGSHSDFLEKGLPATKPPITSQVESGIGYGEEMRMLMKTLIQIQTQQSQQIQLLTQRNLQTFQTQVPILTSMNHLPAFQNMTAL